MAFEMSYIETLTIARLAYVRMGELEKLVARYERYAEDTEIWMEKVTEYQGQLQILRNVYERLCLNVAAVKIQEKFESEGINNEIRKNDAVRRQRTKTKL